MLKYIVNGGKNIGLELAPHKHEDGMYIASSSRFEGDYIRVGTIKELIPYVQKGMKVRMSPKDPSVRHAPSLVYPSIESSNPLKNKVEQVGDNTLDKIAQSINLPSIDTPLSTLPSHGSISCTECFKIEEKVQTINNWRLCNDPGAWGSDSPEILVLGFSKGFTQAKAYQDGQFEDVAFARMRHRLRDILVRVELMDPNQDINHCFTASESRIAFGSLVRCSLSRRDDKTGTWSSTGPLIKKSFHEVPAKEYVNNCTKRFLSSLPECLRIVILLGNDDGYISGVKDVIQRLHADSYKDINPVSFHASGKTWVHVTHPSPLNGHFGNWINGDDSATPGRKRNLAVQAIYQV